MGKIALVIVDMQRYYFDPAAPFFNYYFKNHPGSMDYISTRVQNIVLPNIGLLLDFFRKYSLPIIFLRLCGTQPDRSDLHHAFYEAHQVALSDGVENLYPLADDPMASMPNAIAPKAGESIIDKTTFSAFTSTELDKKLKKIGVDSLVFTGLATSQCVDTTARDAADRGYSIIHIEDAQADYDEDVHISSLKSSMGVCGGTIMSTDAFLKTGD